MLVDSCYNLKKMTARWKNATKMRCKKCRNVVIETFGESVVTGHNVKILETNETTDDSCGIDQTVWYVDNDTAPSWIVDRVSEGNWTKGRLNCPKCSARIGSYDFTSGSKCDCTKFVLPGIHIIKTKVDL